VHTLQGSRHVKKLDVLDYSGTYSLSGEVSTIKISNLGLWLQRLAQYWVSRSVYYGACLCQFLSGNSRILDRGKHLDAGNRARTTALVQAVAMGHPRLRLTLVNVLKPELWQFSDDTKCLIANVSASVGQM
jgi:hypothetical protein